MVTADMPDKVLSDFAVKSLPESAFYLPNFITTEEEEDIISTVSIPNPRPKHIL